MKILEQNYSITQERLDDMLFYKDVSILFHLYAFAGGIGSFQCRLHDPKILTPFDKVIPRNGNINKMISYEKGSVNAQIKRANLINLVKFLNDCGTDEAEVFLRNVSLREKEKLVRRGSEISRLKFSILEQTYSNRFRIPLFLLPGMDFEDDYVSAIDLKRMENNFFHKNDIIWKINPVDYKISHDRIPFSSFCNHTINSVFDATEFKAQNE